MTKLFNFKALISIVIICCGPISYAQDDCRCEDQFILVKDYLKDNYPFYKMKTDGKKKSIHEAYDAVILEKVKTVKSMESCISILKDYLEIYRDGHVAVRYEHQSLDDTFHVMSTYTKEELTTLARHIVDPVIGLYKSNSYRVAIVPSQSQEYEFDGVLLKDANENWKAQQIKFRLKKTEDEGFYSIIYAKTDLTSIKSVAFLISRGSIDLLMIDGFRPYERISKIDEAKKDEADIGDEDITFKRLSDKTFLIKAKSFGGQYKSLIDSLTKKHHHEIIACENLILDVRNNGGGSDYVYGPILPYIYTRPIILDGISYYLSPAHKEMFRGRAKENDERIAKMEKQPDHSFLTPNEVYTHETDTIYQRPLRVAVLHNELTISSGETFVTRTHQSDRVITYGVNTAGIVDGFNGNFVKLGCVTLQYPTTLRSYKLPQGSIDPYGIAPDVYMPGFMDDPYPFILKHIETMKKE